jgi:hypothetical protein
VLRRKLRKAGLLASVDSTRETLLIRRTLEKEEREVLHIKSESLLAGGAPNQRSD